MLGVFPNSQPVDDGLHGIRDSLQGQLARFELQIRKQEAMMTKLLNFGFGFSSGALEQEACEAEKEAERVVQRQERVLSDLLELQSRLEVLLRSDESRGPRQPALAASVDPLPAWGMEVMNNSPADLPSRTAAPAGPAAQKPRAPPTFAVLADVESNGEIAETAPRLNAQERRKEQRKNRVPRDCLATDDTELQHQASYAANCGGAFATKSEGKFGPSVSQIMNQDANVMQDIVEMFVSFWGCPCCDIFTRVSRWYLHMKEPERTGFLFNFVHSMQFEMTCIMVIIANAGFAAYVSDEELASMGGPPSAIVVFVENLFLGWYILELILKFTAHRFYFFVNEDYMWNWFDFVLVAQALSEVLLATFVEEAAGGNLMFMRLFRMLKLTKVIRIARVLKFFRELRLMMLALKDSVVSLFWTIVMLFCILYMFSLIMMQGVAGAILDFHMKGTSAVTMTQEQSDRALELFGSLFASMLTLYKAVTGGADWEEAYIIVSLGGLHYSFLFVFYIAFFTFAVFNILTGMFVENVMKCAEPDNSSIVLDWRQRTREQIQEVKKLFAEFDVDGSGTITWDEFMKQSESETVQAYFNNMEVDVKDAEMFFNVLMRLTDGTAELHCDSFIEGCMRMKGQASSLDLQAVLYQNSVVIKSLHSLRTDLEEELDLMHDRMSGIQGSFHRVKTQQMKKEEKEEESMLHLGELKKRPTPNWLSLLDGGDSSASDHNG